MLRDLQKLFTRAHSALYRVTKGRVVGRFGRTQFLLLHTTGRRSAQERVTPLNYVVDGDAFVVIASNGGASRHPDWYLNLETKPEAEVEVGGRRVAVRATTVDGEQRGRLWDLARASWRWYDSYQQRTEQEIPVVRLERVEG
jgi:deazaflavin-dependent oxidoreductase (nitroreductase family)